LVQIIKDYRVKSVDERQRDNKIQYVDFPKSKEILSLTMSKVTQ
jgi:hypothetical protein